MYIITYFIRFWELHSKLCTVSNSFAYYTFQEYFIYVLACFYFLREDYQQQFKELTHGSSAEEITATFGLLQWNQRQQQGLYNHLYKYGSQYAICYDGGTNFVSNTIIQSNDQDFNIQLIPRLPNILEVDKY